MTIVDLFVISESIDVLANLVVIGVLVTAVYYLLRLMKDVKEIIEKSTSLLDETAEVMEEIMSSKKFEDAIEEVAGEYIDLAKATKSKVESLDIKVSVN